MPRRGGSEQVAAPDLVDLQAPSVPRGFFSDSRSSPAPTTSRAGHVRSRGPPPRRRVPHRALRPRCRDLREPSQCARERAAWYVALAEQLGTILVTADVRPSSAGGLGCEIDDITSMPEGRQASPEDHGLLARRPGHPRVADAMARHGGSNGLHLHSRRVGQSSGPTRVPPSGLTPSNATPVRQRSCTSPRTLPSGSVKVATRRPPPTSRTGSLAVAPAAVTSESFASMSATCQ